MHPVISIDHLEPKKEGLEAGPNAEPGPMHEGGVEEYIMASILRKEIRSVPGERTRKAYYFVKYMGYEHAT